MGARKFAGPGVGAGVGAFFGFGVGYGFGPTPIGGGMGIGAGAGIGVGLGWGYIAGIGAEYINVSPDFLEAKAHKQNPLKQLEGQIRKVFKKPQPGGGHPVHGA